MRKWLVSYSPTDEEEPLYFSSAGNWNGPVWAAHGVIVTDDDRVVTTGIEPIHYSREGAEMLAFNYVMFDKQYMDRISAVECPFRDCAECGTS